MAYATGYKSFGPAGPEKTVLTPEERAVIEAAAKRKGFRGLPVVSEVERSDFVRAGAMALTK